MFWDRVAGVYDLFADIFNKETHKALIAAVSSRITPDDAVLECACGTGLLTGAIAKRCRTLLATDFSANMLKRAKKKYGALPNVTFRQADILHLDEPDGQFDVVIAANVIHLLDEPYKALAELDRVCRSGGMIIVPTYMNRNEQGRTSGFASTVGRRARTSSVSSRSTRISSLSPQRATTMSTTPTVPAACPAPSP